MLLTTGVLTFGLLAASGCGTSKPGVSQRPQQVLATGVEVTVLAIDDRRSPRLPEPASRVFLPRSSATPDARVAQPKEPEGPAAGMTLEESLARFSQAASPLPEPARAAWASNGLAAYIVPAKSIAQFQLELHPTGPLQRQFFAETPRWSQVFRGPQASGVHPILFDSGPVDIGSGAFRLLMRCYLTPADELGSSVLHIDLVPQHVDPRRSAAFESKDLLVDPLSAPKGLPSIADQGAVLEHMLAELALGSDDVLVIVPQSAGPVVASDDPPAPSRPFGPAEPMVPTLGEALLSDALVGGECSRRAVLIFKPILPAAARPRQ